MDQIKKYDSNGKNLVKIVEEIITLLKDILIYKLVPNYFPKEISEDYESLSKRITETNINYVIDSFSDSINKLKNSDNPKIVFDLLLMRLFYFIGNKAEATGKDKPTKIQSLIQKEIIKENPKIETKIIRETDMDNCEIKELPKNKIKQFQNQRVVNILAEFDKQKLKEIKENIKILNEYLFDNNYNKIVSIILDGELKAASNRGLIFVYDSELLSNSFNQNICLIEELLAKAFNYKYCVISIENNNWEIIKKEFNSKSKEYKYIQEDCKVEEIFIPIISNEKNEINNFFGDIVEYNQ